jgi:hypothetical protein
MVPFRLQAPKHPILAAGIDPNRPAVKPVESAAVILPYDDCF